jgi:hypothetical protein
VMIFPFTHEAAGSVIRARAARTDLEHPGVFLRSSSQKVRRGCRSSNRRRTRTGVRHPAAAARRSLAAPFPRLAAVLVQRQLLERP